MAILLHPTYFPTIAQMAAVVQAREVIFEVEDNYQKQTYRNRTYIAHSNGKLLLNIPIKHSKNKQHQKTKEVVIENSFNWQKQHWKSLQSAYRSSPFFEYYEDELFPYFHKPVKYLLEYNISIFKLLCEWLDIEIKISYTKEYQKKTSAIDRRFLVEAKKGKPYLFTPYKQVHEANHGFLNNLSILDLIYNEGTNSLSYLETQTVYFPSPTIQ